MPEMNVRCPQCAVTIRLAYGPEGKSVITCPKCKGRVSLLGDSRPAAPAPRLAPRRGPVEGDWDALVPDNNARLDNMFGSELWVTLVVVGIALVLVVFCFLGGTIATMGLIGLLILAFSLLTFGGIWILVIAFQEDAMCGLMVLFLPFYGLYYIITRFGDCYRALLVQGGAIVVLVLLVIGAFGRGISFLGESDELAGRRGGGARHAGGPPVNPIPPPPVNQAKHFGKDRNDPKFLDLVVEDLKSNDPNHRRQAAEVLAEMRPNQRKDEIVKALLVVADDPLGPQRAAAVKALGVWGEREQLPAILNALKDKDHSVSRAAFEVVARMKDDRAIEPLIESLPRMRDDAARALRAYGKAAEKPLLEAARGANREVKREAIKLLIEMDVKEAGPVITEGLRDTDRDVKKAAMEYVARTRDASAAADLVEAVGDIFVRQQALDALRAIGPPAEKAVVDGLKREDRGQRREMIGLLKEIGTKESVTALRELLMEPRGFDRDHARDALRSIAGRFPKDFPADKPPIWEVDPITQGIADVKSTDLFRKRGGAEALVKNDPKERREEVLKVLEGMLTETDGALRKAGIEGLAAWGGKDYAVKLIKLVTEDDRDSRHWSMTALAKMQEERAIPAITSRLADFFDRGHAVKTLKDYGVKAQVEVSKYCTHTDAGVRHEATKLLGAIGDKEAVPALQKLINQKQDRRLSDIAAQALNELRIRLMTMEMDK
jgi:HEAT repeat protein